MNLTVPTLSVLLIALHILDTLTTHVLLAGKKTREVNPVMKKVVGTWVFVIFKMLVGGALIWWGEYLALLTA